MKPKRQVKPEPRSFFGFTRINKLNEDPSQTSPIYHLLTPLANAKPDHPTAKFTSVFGSQLLLQTGEQQQAKTVNPLYKFHVFHLVATDYISYDFKTTAYKVALLNELTMYMNDQRDKETYDAIRAAAAQIVFQVFQSKATGKWAEVRKQKSRAQRLKNYKDFLDKEGERYADMYVEEYGKHLEVKNRERRARGEVLPQEEVLVTKAYARAQIEVVKQIEPLRFYQQLEKLKYFCDTHKDFFGTELKIDNRFKPLKYSIKINAPSLAAEPTLIRLDDLLELRDPGVDLKMEYLVMARDILYDLNRYRTETHEKSSDKNSNSQGWYHHYHFLSPETVIVDQQSLRAKLSYQLPVRHALGLRNKPCSTEARLAFFCTPKVFDFYQSQAELEEKTRLILDDSHFGHKKMYTKISKECQTLVDEEKRQLEQLSQQMCVDRYLLLCHRMFYNKEFGKTDTRLSYNQIRKHFADSWKDAKAQIWKNPQRLSIFVDPMAHRKELQSFKFTFDQLVDFMDFKEIDSAVESLKHSNLRNLLQLRSTISQKLVSILKDDYFFARVSNAKKYIIIFFVAGIQYLEELRAYWTVDPRNYQEVPVLMGGQTERKNKLKAQITLKNTMAKIVEYKERDHNKEDKHKFLVNDELGKKLYEFVVSLNSKIEGHKQMQREIVGLIERMKKPPNKEMQVERPNQKDQVDQGQSKQIKREQLERKVKDSLKLLDEDIALYKQVIFEFCYFQLQLRYKDSPQRFPEIKQKETGKLALEYYKQVARRFGLILRAFLTCRPDNFVIYDTVLAKMLRFSEHEPKCTEASTLTEQSIKKERSFLFTIDDMLSYTTSAPKAYRHLDVTKKLMEGQLYVIKDDSVFVSSKFKNPNKYLKKEEGNEDEEEDEREEMEKQPVEDKFFKKLAWE